MEVQPLLLRAGWDWSRRKNWLIGLGLNLLVAVAFVGYTDYLPDGTVRVGAVAGIVGFVLSDPINTNQLGPDADRVLEQLSAGVSLDRILLVRNLILAGVLVPLTLALSAVLRIAFDQRGSLPGDLLHDLWVVVGWLALGNISSMLVPFRPLPIKQRLRLRTTWAWWAFGQALPYAMYFLWAFGLSRAVRTFINLFAHGRPSTNWVVGLLQALIAVALVLLCYRICAIYGKYQGQRLQRDLLKLR